MRLSPIVKDLKPSPTLAVSARATAMRAEGIDVINLSLGEPDFPTPEPIVKAAHTALDEGYTKYTPVPGTMALREKISQFLREERGLPYSAAQIVVSTGAKQSLYNAIMSLIGPGDEVIIPAPYWVSYPAQVRLAGGRPVIVETHAKDDFQIDPAAIEAARTPYTRMLILNSPNNPTGAVYRKEALQELAQWAHKHGIWLLSDEIYDHLTYGDAKPYSPLCLHPPAQERGILINGFSKGYAMTGWRVGYMAAPMPVVKASIAIQGACTSGTNSIAQRAAIAALAMPQETIAGMRKTFSERLSFLLERCEKLPHMRCPKPQGAFYLMLDCAAYAGCKTPQGDTLESSVDLANYLLEHAQVALVPGEAFGVTWQLRISYAVNQDILGQAVAQLDKALRALTLAP